MATMHSLALSSSLYRNSVQKPRSYSVSSAIVHGSLNFNSSFNGQHLHVPSLRLPMITQKTPMYTPVIMMAGKPKIQFIQGTDELTIPDVKLTKSKDGTNGMAIFRNRSKVYNADSTGLGSVHEIHGALLECE
ncbi:Photosystem II reaction center psb28 protein [Lathyrus oleraceus]|uniref:Photosystem II reaction center Psb28 protein n=1 Tax=Pisum sativum TaxID=3888 RepID=A0A9D4W6J0_PEA|nr:Photosystem II reaction center psb28 protein [Pisum sativum]